MKSQFSNARANNNYFDPRVGNAFDNGIKLFLFTLAEISEFLGGVEENSSLGFREGNVEGTSVNGDLGLGSILNNTYFSCMSVAVYTIKKLNHTLWLTTKDHSSNDLGVVNGTTKNLDNADRVNVEVGRLLGHNLKSRLDHKTSKKVLVSVLCSNR